MAIVTCLALTWVRGVTVYNPTNPKFYLFSLTSSYSHSPHNLPSSPFLLVTHKQSSRIPKMLTQKNKNRKHNLLDFEYIFLMFAWCLVFGCWENVGKQREIGLFLIFVCSLDIYMILSIFSCVWVLRKCWKAMGNRFFFSLIVWLLRKHGLLFVLKTLYSCYHFLLMVA